MLKNNIHHFSLNNIWLRVIVSIALVAILFVFIPAQDIWQQLLRLKLHLVLLSFCFLFLHLCVSSIRFGVLNRKFQTEVPALITHKINIYSLIYSLFFIPALAQIIGRVQHSKNYTKHGHLYVSMTFFEKIISAFVLLCIAMIGGVLGTKTFTIETSAFFYLTVMLCSTMTAGTLVYVFVLSAEEKDSLKYLLRQIVRLGIVPICLITIVLHILTLSAFLSLGVHFFADVSLLTLASALSVVMLASAVPISFAGWGVRELSAAAVFSQLGLSISAAVLLSALIGLLFLIALGLHFSLVFLLSSKTFAIPNIFQR